MPESGIDVIDNLISIGYMIKMQDGVRPIDWSSVNEWCKATGVVVNAWHAETLISMSKIYTQVSINSLKQSYQCPVDIQKKINNHKLEKLDSIFR